MKYPALILSAAIISIVITCCKDQKSSYQADAFIGEWYAVKGDLDAYSFMKDSNNYIYVGTLNMHPAAFGTWRILNNKFVIISDIGNSASYRYTLSNDTLIFNEGEQIYTRTEPLEVRFPEVKILIALADDFGSLKFSSPQQADLNWASFTDKAGNLQNPSIIGYVISTTVTATTENLAEIYSSLEEYGFEPDTVIIKESCKVFHDDNQVVTICVARNTDNNNSFNIQITSGYVSK